MVTIDFRPRVKDETLGAGVILVTLVVRRTLELALFVSARGFGTDSVVFSFGATFSLFELQAIMLILASRCALSLAATASPGSAKLDVVTGLVDLTVGALLTGPLTLRPC